MMAQPTHNPVPTAEPLERLDSYDPSFGKARERFEGAPSLHLTPAQQEHLSEFKALHYRDKRHRELVAQRNTLLAIPTRSATDEERLAEVVQLLTLPDNQPLTAEQAATKVGFDKLLGEQVVAYLERSRVELEQAPKAGAFEGFTSLEDEIEADTRGEPTHFSVLALEEVRVLLNRLFGKYHSLKAFFEEYVVLRYDGERAVKRAQDMGSPQAAERGGAEISRQYVGGKSKYVVTVDDATFIHTKSFTDDAGNTHRYTTADMVASAFTIGRAILRTAMNDELLTPVAKAHGAHLKGGEQFVHKLEQLNEGGAPRVIDRQRSHGHGLHEHTDVDDVLDFMALMLVDPEQAKRVDADLGKNWESMAGKLLKGLNPDQRLELANDQTLTVEQAHLNYDYLYHDYDLKRRPPNALAGKVSDWWISTGHGEQLRALGGAGVIGSALGLFIGGTAIGPWRVWAGLIAGGVGLASGAKLGRWLGGFDAPLKLIRSIQAVWEEKSDFFYELAESEHDKKEVARIIAREEQIGDRDARLKTLIATKNAVDMRRVLQADSETGDWTPWRQLLYVMHFDHLFIKTGGREITQESYNFLQRLQRISAAKKRHGTKPNYYKAVRDPYGRTRYQLRDWDEVDKHVRYEWESRSEREAQGVIQEQFELMDDGQGWVGVNDKLGDNLNDPNSRGWNVGQVGDLRKLLGEAAAKEFLETLRTTIGAVDERYLWKMDTYCRNTVQRMYSFIDKKFPGEHAKIISKEAYTHYLDKLPKYEIKLTETQEEMIETLETKSAEQLIDDSDVPAEKLVQLYRNVEFGTIDEEFPSRAKPKFPTLMVRGWLDSSLQHLKADVIRYRGEPYHLDDALVYEMEGLANTLQESLAEQKPPAVIEHEIHAARENLERLLDRSSVDEKQEFLTRTWLIRLTERQPQVEALTKFRESLREQLKPYRAAVNAGRAEQAQVGTTLDQLRAIHADFEAAGAGDVPALVADRQEELTTLGKRLLAEANGLLGRGKEFPKQKQALFLALDVASTTRVPEHLDKLIKEFGTWFDAYAAEEKPKRVTGELEQVQILLGELYQFERTAEVPQEVAGERAAKLRELKSNFVALTSVPEAERALDLHPAGMIRCLKLAYAALSIDMNEKEWKGESKKEKGDEEYGW